MPGCVQDDQAAVPKQIKVCGGQFLQRRYAAKWIEPVMFVSVKRARPDDNGNFFRQVHEACHMIKMQVRQQDCIEIVCPTNQCVQLCPYVLSFDLACAGCCAQKPAESRKPGIQQECGLRVDHEVREHRDLNLDLFQPRAFKINQDCVGGRCCSTGCNIAG